LQGCIFRSYTAHHLGDRAHEILEGLGAGKPGAAVRARAFWAIARVLGRMLDEATVEAILEVGRRTPTGGDTIYRKVLLVTAPFKNVLTRLERFGEAIGCLEPIERHAAGYPYAARVRASALFRLGYL
jgi:hypothetical protein